MLVDADLCLGHGPATPRPTAGRTAAAELPSGGTSAPSPWENYARAVTEWMEFPWPSTGVRLFDSRERLRAG